MTEVDSMLMCKDLQQTTTIAFSIHKADCVVTSSHMIGLQDPGNRHMRISHLLASFQLREALQQ